MKRLFIVLLVMVMLLTLIGCQNEEKVELKKTDLGYNFSDFLDKDGEDLIKQLEADGAELQLIEDYSEDEYPYQGRIYQLTEKIFDLEYIVKLTIANQEDGKNSALVLFSKSIEFDQWPEEAEGEAIQKTVEAMVNQYEPIYGEVTYNDVDPERLIEGIPSDKSIQWYKADFVFCGLDIMYDPPTERTSIKIFDESAEWKTKVLEYYENQ